MIQSWSIDLSRQTGTVNKPLKGWVPFRVNGYFGYASPDGKELFRSPVQGGVEISSSEFCNYDHLGGNLVLHNPGENLIYPIDLNGYPYLCDDTLFVLTADMTGFSAVSSQGEVLYTRRFTTLITALDAAGGVVSVGLLNGTVQLFDPQGNDLGTLHPVGSRIKVVYGTAVSHDGRIVAVTHGIDPQIVSIYRRQPEGFKRVNSYTLRRPLRSQVVMGFMPGDTKLLVEERDGVGLFDTGEPYKRQDIQLHGQLVDFVFSSGDRTVFLLTRQDGTQEVSNLYLLSADGTVYSRETMSGQGTWISYVKNAVYLGVGDTLTKIAIGKGM